MLAYSNCKINLGLFVTAKRTDGYHDIESVFYPLDWSDAIEIEENPLQKGCTLIEYNAAVTQAPQQNLCWKAYNLLATEFNLPGINLHLYKTIPTGAGLGGGSSNASTTLKLLNKKFNLGLNNTQLATYAATLGSDCPFFIYNTPSYVTGRGEIMESISLDLSKYYFVLVHPGVHMSTAEAYAMIQPKASKIDLKTKLLQEPVAKWNSFLYNDFETVVAQKHPVITTIKTEMMNNGALYSSMSGSGSTVFGIFATEENAKNSLKQFSTFSTKLIYPLNYLAKFV